MKQSAYTGKGVGVALFDTGIYPHMDFGDRIYAFADFISYRKLPYDDNGHGACVCVGSAEAKRSGFHGKVQRDGTGMFADRAEGAGFVLETAIRRISWRRFSGL